MKKQTKIYFTWLSFFLLILFLSGCVEKTSESLINSEHGVLETIEVLDLVCITGSPIRSILGGKYLDFWEYQDNILHLFFKFNVTCGSAFKDSIITVDNKIHIFLADTSSQHYKCICDHENQVSLVSIGLKEIRLKLDIMEFSQTCYHNCLDTILVLN